MKQTYDPLRKVKLVNVSKEETLRRVSTALDQIEYGEIIVKIQGGKPIWVDKNERHRVG